MKFGMIQEAWTPVGVTHHRRYHEVVREVQAAEEAGFDFWGTSEQHFVSPHATVTAPDDWEAYEVDPEVTARIKAAERR